MQNNICIYIKDSFPDKIEKDSYILSEYAFITYEAYLEFYILKYLLNKPLEVCVTSGHWYGNAFLIKTSDNFYISKEERKLIEKYKQELIVLIDKTLNNYRKEKIDAE